MDVSQFLINSNHLFECTPLIGQNSELSRDNKVLLYTAVIRSHNSLRLSRTCRYATIDVNMSICKSSRAEGAGWSSRRVASQGGRSDLTVISVGTSGQTRRYLHGDQAQDALDRPVVEKIVTSYDTHA
ncbi:hypothetical protein TNCV_5094211 [Trichonephila clavipes]|nr:hypothetical protein TNCV_5094211 [Trichonephila clavipes]